MLIVIMLTVSVNAQDYGPAVNKITEALYVDSYVRRRLEFKLELYKEKVPKEIKPTLDIIIPLTDVLIQRRIELTWEFK